MHYRSRCTNGADVYSGGDVHPVWACAGSVIALA
jgi:hypothetical protein